jgi:hypothetical protein
MSLPRWNPRWDRHDPRGGPGWSIRRYLNLLVSVVAAVVFTCLALSLFVTAAARAKKQRQRMEAMEWLRQEAFEERAEREFGGEK